MYNIKGGVTMICIATFRIISMFESRTQTKSKLSLLSALTTAGTLEDMFFHE